jgi:hypothetical protein
MPTATVSSAGAFAANPLNRVLSAFLRQEGVSRERDTNPMRQADTVRSADSSASPL